MAEINDWDVAASGNGFTVPDGFPEGMNYSQVNNAARELMAVVRRANKDHEGELLSTGSGGTYVLASARTIAAYANGQSFRLRANHSNTGASTVSVSGLASVAIVTPKNEVLTSGAITINGVYDIAYSSALAKFVLLGSFSTLQGTVVAQATDAAPGVSEHATLAELVTGTDLERVASVAGLTALFNDSTRRTDSATAGMFTLPGGLKIKYGRSADLGDIPGGAVQTLSLAFSTTVAFDSPPLIAFGFAMSLGTPNDMNVFVYWDQPATTSTNILFDYKETSGFQSNWAIGYIAIGV